MKCPNCGKNVRSKNQCAHCGHMFNKNDFKEGNNPKDDYIGKPRPKRSSGVGSLIWGLFKLVIGVAVLFLLFLFGPRIFNSVVEYFQPTDSQVVQNVDLESKDSNEETKLEEDNSVTNSDSQSERHQVTSEDKDKSINQTNSELNSTDEETKETSQSETSTDQETTSSEETTKEEPVLTLVESQVNLDDYPLININLEFDKLDTNINGEDFTFNVETNGDVVNLKDDYSLMKEGSHLILSFNDPTINVLTTDTIEQTLKINSPKFNFEDSVQYDLPGSTLDSELANNLNEIINNNLAEIANVSAVIYDENSETPFIYENQNIDAGALIGWFVIANTYNQVDGGEFALEDEFPMNPSLIGENDQGKIANAEEGTEFTIQEYILEIIYNRDVTAMNHLIDLTGGPNDFNLWLNESGFFATRMTQLLSLDEEYHIKGSVTNAQDIANLLVLLSNSELTSPELDEIFLANLLDSPITEKFPYEKYDVRRFEMASGDDNLNDQHYSAIIETDNGSYIIVILANDFDEAQGAVEGISQSIDEILSLMLTGEVTEETVEESFEETTEIVATTEEDNQVEIINNNENNEQNVSGNTGQFESWQLYESESGIVYGPDSDGDGFRDTYRNSAGEFTPIQWYQGEDGLWYFNEGN